MTRAAIAAALIALLCAGPAAAEVNRAAIEDRRPPKVLSDFGFFEDEAARIPADGVRPYTVTAPLWTDGAEKDRYVVTPAPATARGAGLPDFPVGSALIKTFRYGARKIETRVLLHGPGGWKAWPYLWNDDGTEARLKIAGADLDLAGPEGPIAYRVPSAAQCKACHVSAAGVIEPIGPKLRNLGQEQAAQWAQAGVIGTLPEGVGFVPDYTDAEVPLVARARAYLDANCGHCHVPGGPADTSGLYLHWEEDRAIHLGIGKRPVAAGRGSGGLKVSIAPGAPGESILLYRMGSTDPGVMMPEIGRSIVDPVGLALIEDWIASLAE